MSLRSLQPAFGREIEEVLDRALSRIPSDRFSTCAELVWKLAEAMAMSVYRNPLNKLMTAGM